MIDLDSWSGCEWASLCLWVMRFSQMCSHLLSLFLFFIFLTSSLHSSVGTGGTASDRLPSTWGLKKDQGNSSGFSAHRALVWILWWARWLFSWFFFFHPFAALKVLHLICLSNRLKITPLLVSVFLQKHPYKHHEALSPSVSVFVFILRAAPLLQ